MSTHDFETRLRSWARAGSDRPAPAELRQQVLDFPTTEPSASHRRRRRLWFLPVRAPTAWAPDGHEHGQPAASTTESNGRLDAPRGGTRTMFSTAKLVGLAAALALFAALALAVPLNPPQSGPAPAAPAFEPGEITPYTGKLRVLGQDVTPNPEGFDWGEAHMGEQWTVRLEMSDPRMSGVASSFHNVYTVTPDKTYLRTYKARVFTENPDGTWLETGRGYQDPETTGIQYQSYLEGEGAFEGLFAISSCGQQRFSANFDCEGVILEGGLPETPAEAPDEVPEAHTST